MDTNINIVLIEFEAAKQKILRVKKYAKKSPLIQAYMNKNKIELHFPRNKT